jgi:acetyl esterase/lipase
MPLTSSAKSKTIWDGSYSTVTLHIFALSLLTPYHWNTTKPHIESELERAPRHSFEAVFTTEPLFPHMSTMATPLKYSIVYKRIHGLEISLDVHMPANAQSVPILLWFHGGGLLQGHREGIAPHMLESVNKYNHALISADYRLAPQVGMHEIMADVRDCIRFIRDPFGLARDLVLHGIVGPCTVDASRLAVSGSSAGGYLALLAGLYANPKPNVILPIYPITDPLGTFFTTSQPVTSKFDLERHVADDTVRPFLERDFSTAVANSAPNSDRRHMYSYMLSRANLADLLHFHTKPDPQHDRSNDTWRIAKQIESRRLPSTYIVHGTADSAVGVEQADEVVGAMLGEGLEVKYERLSGKEHVFDKDPREKLESMYEFMHKHV